MDFVLFLSAIFSVFAIFVFRQQTTEKTDTADRNTAAETYTNSTISSNSSTLNSNSNTISSTNSNFSDLNMTLRTIKTILPGIEQPEGAGATVRRSIGNMNLRHFSPFLMFDHFSSSGVSGFPQHPHLGQETITLMLKGAFAHEDFTGSKGVLREGDLQFMTAGRGTVHSEMPVAHKDGSANVGLQLWVDLPEKLKEVEPRYRDLKTWEVPEVQEDKVKVRIISGKSFGVESVKELAYTPVQFYHYTLEPGAKFSQQVPADYNFFLYVLNGKNLVLQGKAVVKQYENVFFNPDGTVIEGEYPESEKNPLEFVLIGGEILHQPIVQHGPFVATSRERIQQAFMDYQYGRNGFERMKSWNSLISAGVDDDMINNQLGGSFEAREKERQAYLSKKAVS